MSAVRYVLQNVRPERDANRRDAYRKDGGVMRVGDVAASFGDHSRHVCASKLDAA